MNIVYSYYVLDIVHRGHLLMLKNAKAIAGHDGRLVVGIVSDEAVAEVKGRAPVLSFSERLELAQAIRYVDLVVRQDEYSPVKNIGAIKPTILMESESHTNAQLESSRKCMEKIGGKMIVMPYYKGQSSTRIKNLSANAINSG